jgi:hypothetical protein
MSESKDDRDSVRATLERAYEEHVEKSHNDTSAVEPLPQPTSIEHFIPRSWGEAWPLLIWGFLALAFAFVFAESIGELFKDPALRAGMAFASMVGLAALVIYRSWLIARFTNASGTSLVFAIGTAILVLASAPYVEQGQWPYSRARKASAPAEPEKVCWGGPCATYEGSPLGWAWEQYNVSIQIPARSTDSPLIQSFGLLGKNVAQEEVNLRSAYIVSDIDGSRLPLKVRIEPNDLIDVTDAKAVPPSAEFSLIAAFNPPMPEGEFLRTWGALSAIVEYDGGKVRHVYSRQLIRSQIDASNPYARPHVTRRNQ